MHLKHRNKLDSYPTCLKLSAEPLIHSLAVGCVTIKNF